MTYFMLLLLRPCTKWRGRKKIKSTSFNQYSWNSKVETTWISLIGWHHKTSSVEYVCYFVLPLSLVSSGWIVSLIVCPREGILCVCNFLEGPRSGESVPFSSTTISSSSGISVISSGISGETGGSSVSRGSWSPSSLRSISVSDAAVPSSPDIIIKGKS